MRTAPAARSPEDDAAQVGWGKTPSARPAGPLGAAAPLDPLIAALARAVDRGKDTAG